MKPPQFLENFQNLILYSRGSLFDSEFFSEKPKTAVLWFYQKTASISKF
jgi:hypothetical protein